MDCCDVIVIIGKQFARKRERNRNEEDEDRNEKEDEMEIKTAIKKEEALK